MLPKEPHLRVSKGMKEGLGEGRPSPASRPGVDENYKGCLWQVWHHKLLGFTQVRQRHPALFKQKWRNVFGKLVTDLALLHRLSGNYRWQQSTAVLTCTVHADLLQSCMLCILLGQPEGPQAAHITKICELSLSYTACNLRACDVTSPQQGVWCCIGGSVVNPTSRHCRPTKQDMAVQSHTESEATSKKHSASTTC